MRWLAVIAVLASALALASCNGNGSSGEVVASVSSTGSVSTAATGPTDVPLQDNTWTQEADESNLLLARISLDSPQNCPANPPVPEAPRSLRIQLEVDGEPLHQEAVSNSGIPPLSPPPTGPPSGGKQFDFNFQASLLRTGSETDRTLTAKVIEIRAIQGCTPATWTVDSLEVDVIRFK
jgi:predicted small secreted protein